jgi:hypothetical protein
MSRELRTPLERRQTYHAALRTAARHGERSKSSRRSRSVDEREGCGIQLRTERSSWGFFFNALYKTTALTHIPPEEKERKFLETGKRYLGAYTISYKTTA